MKLAMGEARAKRRNVNAVDFLVRVQRFRKRHLHRFHSGIERIANRAKQQTDDRSNIQYPTGLSLTHCREKNA